MKAYFKEFSFSMLFALVLGFYSCSSEEQTETQINEDEVFTVSSESAGLIKNMVSNDGSFDNIIDRASCFDIDFPYKVVVNGIQITIKSADDLEKVEKVIDASDNDLDTVNIVFPITIINSDYTEATINNSTDLKTISAKCVEGGADDDIECIDMVFPITLFAYNTDIEKTNTVEVESDKDLRRFLAGLSENDIISIEYPILFEVYDGTKVTVSNNKELEKAIRLVKDACDEDDDNDFSDDDFTKERLDGVLIDCFWQVSELVRDDIQNLVAENYLESILNFKEDGDVLKIDRAGNTLTGNWSTQVSDNRVKLTISFEAIEVFNLEWLVNEINEDKIKLFFSDNNNKIILNKTCTAPNFGCSEAFIKANLSGPCLWALSNGIGISFLDNFRIDFSNMSIIARDANGTIVDEGNWEIKETTITIDGLSQDLSNLVGEWQMIGCTVDRFKMKRGEEFLVVEKDCN